MRANIDRCHNAESDEIVKSSPFHYYDEDNVIESSLADCKKFYIFSGASSSLGVTNWCWWSSERYSIDLFCYHWRTHTISSKTQRTNDVQVCVQSL